MERRHSCKEVAQLYGVKIITVWSWIRSGKLNAVKPGKNYFIREEDLMAFESAGR